MKTEEKDIKAFKRLMKKELDNRPEYVSHVSFRDFLTMLKWDIFSRKRGCVYYIYLFRKLTHKAAFKRACEMPKENLPHYIKEQGWGSLLKK